MDMLGKVRRMKMRDKLSISQMMRQNANSLNGSFVLNTSQSSIWFELRVILARFH